MAETEMLTWRFGALSIPIEATRDGSGWMLKAIGRKSDLIVQDTSFAKAAARLRTMIELKIKARAEGLV